MISGKNALRDPALRALYDQVRLIETGLLFDSARLHAIWAMNTGEAKHLVAQAKYDPNTTFAPGLAKTSADRLSCMGQLDPLLTVHLK